MVRFPTARLFSSAETMPARCISMSAVVRIKRSRWPAANHWWAFASITPAAPGGGLAWNTSQLNSGVISVVAAAQSQPVINSTVVSGGNLIFSGTNGTAGGTYYVLTSTNVSGPLSSWTSLSTNTFGPGGVFSVTNAINPATPKRFYVLKLP